MREKPHFRAESSFVPGAESRGSRAHHVVLDEGSIVVKMSPHGREGLQAVQEFARLHGGTVSYVPYGGQHRTRDGWFEHGRKPTTGMRIDNMSHTDKDFEQERSDMLRILAGRVNDVSDQHPTLSVSRLLWDHSLVIVEQVGPDSSQRIAITTAGNFSPDSHPLISAELVAESDFFVRVREEGDRETILAIKNVPSTNDTQEPAEVTVVVNSLETDIVSILTKVAAGIGMREAFDQYAIKAYRLSTQGEGVFISGPDRPPFPQVRDIVNSSGHYYQGPIDSLFVRLGQCIADRRIAVKNS